MKILHIEDTDIFLEMGEELFKSFDFVSEYVSAENGLKGYKLAKSGKFDVIITDGQLPGMLGKEIISRLRSEGYKGPIIANSAGYNSDLMKAGADYEMEKDFMNDDEWRELLLKIKNKTKSNPRKKKSNPIPSEYSFVQYTRVVPRDLFNEAKLLKCLGKVALSILDGKLKEFNLTEKHTHEDEGFIVLQNEDGDIMCENYRVFKGKEEIYLFTRLNSRANWPLMTIDHRNEYIEVLNDEGKFTKEFINYLTSVK
jgi:DNA-binding response OmpR family regulator